MNLKIIITAPARLEIAEAVKYYEEQRPSAGARFWIEFKILAKRLKIFPNFIHDLENAEFAKRQCTIIRTQFIIESPETNCAYSALCMAR
ncbi:MAG: hypothetical protein ACREDS_02065 [Limisphaerales bacterium]